MLPTFRVILALNDINFWRPFAVNISMKNKASIGSLLSAIYCRYLCRLSLCWIVVFIWRGRCGLSWIAVRWSLRRWCRRQWCRCCCCVVVELDRWCSAVDIRSEIWNSCVFRLKRCFSGNNYFRKLSRFLVCVVPCQVLVDFLSSAGCFAFLCRTLSTCWCFFYCKVAVLLYVVSIVALASVSCFVGWIVGAVSCDICCVGFGRLA